MADYVLSCCSLVDLTEEYLNKRDIKYISLDYELDGKLYRDDFGKTITYEKFYQMMDEGAMTKTTQINPERFEEYFSQFLDQGKDIIHVTFSSGLTGMINSLLIAKEELAEKYPDRKLIIVDSLGASSGLGLLVDMLADLRDEGKSIEEVAQFAENNKLKVNHEFFSTDLKYYIRGGRISKAAGFVGQALNICPLCHMDKLGHLVPIMKIRTKKKTIQTVVDRMKEKAENGLDYNRKCFLCYSTEYQEAQEVADLINETFPKLNGPVQLFNIGPIIGCHTGPGTISIFYYGKERTE